MCCTQPGLGFLSAHAKISPSSRHLCVPHMDTKHIQFPSEGCGRCSCCHPVLPAPPGTKVPAVTWGPSEPLWRTWQVFVSLLYAGLWGPQVQSSLLVAAWAPGMLNAVQSEQCDMCLPPSPQHVIAAVAGPQFFIRYNDCSVLD